MTAPSSQEHWILCGGVEHPDAPADALRITAARAGKDIGVDITGISDALTGRVSNEFRDLILIAAYVLAADGAIYRGSAEDTDFGRKWRRRMHFVVGVENPELWSAAGARTLMESTVGFLSDDVYSFEFVPARTAVSEQLSFSGPHGEPILRWDHVDEVLLFSGGLDSLCGAADAVLRHGRRAILVSHLSASKTIGTQRALADELRKLVVRKGGWGPAHVGVRVVKHHDALRRERTQRSRTFLFAAIAGAVAQLIGQDVVKFYENGVVSLNLPISRQLVGAKATRTTHPKVLRGLGGLLSIASGRPIRVENPFEHVTRAETLDRIVGTGAESLVRYSVSCAYVHLQSVMHRHCGVCTQCIDRRFATLARGLEDQDPAEGYALDLVRDAWADDRHKTVLLDYIEAADRFAKCRTQEEFLATFGEASRALDGLSAGFDEEVAAVFDLHRRHGETIGGVLSTLLARHAEDLRYGRLPPQSLLRLLASAPFGSDGGDGQADEPADPVLADPESDNVFQQKGEIWVLRFRAGKPVYMTPSKGLKYIRYLLERPDVGLNAFQLIDLDEGREEASHPLGIALSADREAIDQVTSQIKGLEDARALADECGDAAEVARCEEEMKKLAAYLAAEAGPGGKSRRESTEVKRVRQAVSKAIRRAIADIKKKDKALGQHLHGHVRTGFVSHYIDGGVGWDV